MTRTPKRELNSCRPRTTLIRGLTADRLQRFTPRDPFTVSFSRVRKKRCGPTWKARSSEREKEKVLFRNNAEILTDLEERTV